MKMDNRILIRFPLILTIVSMTYISELELGATFHLPRNQINCNIWTVNRMLVIISCSLAFLKISEKKFILIAYSMFILIAYSKIWIFTTAYHTYCYDILHRCQIYLFTL